MNIFKFQMRIDVCPIFSYKLEAGRMEKHLIRSAFEGWVRIAYFILYYTY